MYSSLFFFSVIESTVFLHFALAFLSLCMSLHYVPSFLPHSLCLSLSLSLSLPLSPQPLTRTYSFPIFAAFSLTLFLPFFLSRLLTMVGSKWWFAARSKSSQTCSATVVVVQTNTLLLLIIIIIIYLSLESEIKRFKNYISLFKISRAIGIYYWRESLHLPTLNTWPSVISPLVGVEHTPCGDCYLRPEMLC